MVKISYVLGTRPEIIKLYSLINESKKLGVDFSIIHTNQHYDANMDKIFFDELELPLPKYNLNIGSDSQNNQVGRMLIELEKVLNIEQPNIVIVQGDTNTVLAGALAASKMSFNVAHVEAGLRSYDRSMPEEVNRIIADHLSNYLFAPTEIQKNILLNEGIDSNNIFITGNTIVDAVCDCIFLAKKKSKILNFLNIEEGNFFLLTCHRPSNTDTDNFEKIISSISKICDEENLKCVFPIHPRLNNRIDFLKKYKNFIITKPLGYLDLLSLQKNAKMIFTDSGGIQEESCILRKKCLILRLNTERPETIEVGGSILLDNFTIDEIMFKYKILMNRTVSWYNPFGDGFAYKKILKEILK